MTLDQDIKLFCGSRDWSPTQYLRINSGVDIRRASLFSLLERHASQNWKSEQEILGCYQARSDWRPLNEDELSRVVGITDRDAVHSTVQIFELPAHLVDLARKHTENCLRSDAFEIRPHTGTKMIRGEFMQPLENLIQDWLFKNICESFDMGMALGMFIRVNPPGRNSSTGFELRGWDGLHIDHWGGNPWLQTKRNYNGSHFIMNLGEETRHFIFINLRLATIATRYAKCIPEKIFNLLMRRDCPNTGLLANAFMEACPDYPVLRVTLPPNFGYISNTVALPHDGYLVGKEKQDIAILMPHMVPHKVESDVDVEEALSVAPPKYKDAWIRNCKELSSVH